jgi:hypothetical protein
MLETLFVRLLAGDAGIPGQFAAAKFFWDAFFIEHGDKPEAELAKVLTVTQSLFYTKVAPGDYDFAKLIMPLTAIGSLYDAGTGFQGDNLALAWKVVRAFEQSHVSGEVKGSYLHYARAIYGPTEASPVSALI